MVEGQVQGTQGSGTEVKPENKQKGDLTQKEQMKQKVPKSTAGTVPGGYWPIRAAKHVGRNVAKYVVAAAVGAGGTLYVQEYMHQGADGKYVRVLDLRGAQALGIELRDVVLTPIVEFDPNTGAIKRGKPVKAESQSLVAILDPNEANPNSPFDTIYVIGYDRDGKINVRHRNVNKVDYRPGIPADPNDSNRPGRYESVTLSPNLELRTNIPRVPGYTAARRGGQRR